MNLSPAVLRQHLDDKRALELRLTGLKWKEIGDQLGVTDQTARAMCKRAMGVIDFQTAELAEDMRDLIVERNEQMVAKIFPNALKGDLFAIDRIVKLQEQSGKLLGSYPKEEKYGGDVHVGPVIVLPAVLSEQSVPEALPPGETQMVVGGMVVAAQEPEDAAYDVIEVIDEPKSDSERTAAEYAEFVAATSRATNSVYEQSGLGGSLRRERGPWEDGLSRDGGDPAD